MTKLFTLPTSALYALIEEAGEGEDWDDLVEAAEAELDAREMNVSIWGHERGIDALQPS